MKLGPDRSKHSNLYSNDDWKAWRQAMEKLYTPAEVQALGLEGEDEPDTFELASELEFDDSPLEWVEPCLSSK